MFSGSTSGASPVQPTVASTVVASNEGFVKQDPSLLLKMGVAAQIIGAPNTLVYIVTVNKNIVARMAPPALSRDDETFSEKRKKGIIRSLKTEQSESPNDQRPDS